MTDAQTRSSTVHEGRGQGANDHTWFLPLRTIESRGAMSTRPTRLGDLAKRRSEVLAQYWTPEGLVDLVWSIVTPAIDAARQRTGGRVAILDSSCGVGRFFWRADPAKHTIGGMDIDAAAISALAAHAEQAGFHCNLRAGRLEDMRPRQFAVGLLNPPFGLALTSPALEPFEGITTWGKFGPDTSAVSHLYAVAQALVACQIVVAVLPMGALKEMEGIPAFAHRLRATIELPRGTFREENTDVQTGLAIFGQRSRRGAVQHIGRLANLSPGLPPFDLECDAEDQRGRPRLNEITIAEDQPVITQPVIGDPRVWIAHDGRKVIIKTRCGFARARALNAVLQSRIDRDALGQGVSLPRGVQYRGQAWLDLEHHLLQPDTIASFEQLAARIRAAGVQVIVDPGVLGYLRKRVRADAMRRVPLQKTVFIRQDADLSTLRNGECVTATAHKTHVCDPGSWKSAIVIKGRRVTIEAMIEAHQREYRVVHDGKHVGRFTREQIDTHYRVDVALGQKGWKQVHAGRWASHPQRCAERERIARALGLDKLLSWDFQLRDTVELSIAPRGISAWYPALGKTRQAFALCRIRGGRHNLIAVEARLVEEICSQFIAWGIDRSLWQVIRTPEDARALKCVNIISYERLRREIAPGAGRRTFASLLRRRLHTVVADEAGLVANRASDQTRALWKLSPKCRYVLDGNPVGNYINDALPILQWAAADGSAVMRYGHHGPYVDPQNLTTMANSRRGVDVFIDRHVTTTWYTSEWRENGGRDGARRQVPHLRDVEGFRDLIAPHVLRRVPQEPDVCRYVKLPEATVVEHQLDFDPEHLSRYLCIAMEFASWYRESKRRADEAGRGLNLVTVLARIRAVQDATNVPDRAIGCWPADHRLTSKDRRALALIEQFHREGRSTILFANSPLTLQRLERECARRGIAAIPFHGGSSIAARTRASRRARDANTPGVQLTSFGCGTRGHNWHFASRTIFYDECWTPDTIEQAGRRVLRPEQTSDVESHRLRITGSIDDYQRMMCDMKAEAVTAGLDYGEQTTGPEEFLHMDTILSRFCDDLATRWGVDRTEARERARGDYGRRKVA